MNPNEQNSSSPAVPPPLDPPAPAAEVAKADEARQKNAVAAAVPVEPVPAEPKADYVPIPIKPAFNVVIMVGARIPPAPTSDAFEHKIPLQNRTMPVKAYETVVDLLNKMSLPADGSMVLLIPGTALPFGMMEFPYDGIRDGATLFVVPNNVYQVGPDVDVTKALPPLPPPPFDAIVLHDTTDKKRPDVTANNKVQLAAYVDDGYAE